MPPASKKNCSVILFDLATQNRERALQTLLKICCLNHFSDSKDLTKLVLLNSDITENRLNAHYGGYEDIFEVAKEVGLYDPKEQLEMIEDSGTGSANWLEGLSVALKNLEEEFESIGGIITLQLLFITDLASPLTNYRENIVDEIIQDIKKMGAYLYIVGPNVEAPFTIKNPETIKIWMDNLIIDENNQNMKLAKEIVTKTKNSVICDFKMGVHLFFSYRNSGGTQPWQVPLGIGTKINIPAQTMKILDEGMPVKLTSEGRFGNTIWVDAEDESIEIDPADVRHGIKRHGKFVIIEDNKMFQVENPRGFNVLCFTDSKNVPELLMRGEGCYCVLPNGEGKQNEAMYSLIDCLAERNQYVIARRVYNANYIPKIVVLIPKPDHNPKCFYLATLPFSEEVRRNYVEKKVEAAPPIEKVDEVYNFLDSINTEGDESQKKVPLGIPMMVDHNCQKLINKCCDKLLEKYMRLEEVDLDYTAEAPSGDAVEALKNLIPERKVEEEKNKAADNGDDNSDNDFDWE